VNNSGSSSESEYYHLTFLVSQVYTVYVMWSQKSNK